jgi:hypothetical protein
VGFDINLSHGGRKIAKNWEENKGRLVPGKGAFFYLAPRSKPVICP